MPVVIIPAPGAVRTRVRVNIRRGAPSAAAPRSRTAEADETLRIIGTATGVSVAGIDRWYALENSEFVWSGACSDDDQAGEADNDRPDRRAMGDYVPPDIRVVPGVRHKAQGLRPGGLEGLIVHFDAYRIRAAGNGPEASDSRTLDMLRSGEDNGFHYVEISRTGTIFMPEGFNWLEWGSHAGTSRCPRTGRTGVSRYYVGVEMNNPGVLYPTADPDIFCPWFNARRNEQGNVILDAQGKCVRRSASDEWYKQSEVRFVPAQGNIHPHWYLPYSHAQFEALTNLVLYLARRYPDSFRIENVLGHDEVAPTRKDDPGGALASPDEVMTMEAFRTYLRDRGGMVR